MGAVTVMMFSYRDETTDRNKNTHHVSCRQVAVERPAS